MNENYSITLSGDSVSLENALKKAADAYSKVIEFQDRMTKSLEELEKKRQKQVEADISLERKHLKELQTLAAQQKALELSGTLGGSGKRFEVARAALIDYVTQHKVTREQVESIWNQVSVGNISKYTKTLSGLQDSLLALKQASTPNRRERVDAYLNERSRRNIVELTDTIQPASGTSHLRFNQARAALIDYVSKNRIAKQEIDRIWSEVSSGNLSAQIGQLQRVQSLMVALRTEHANTATSWTDALNTQVRQSQRLVEAIQHQRKEVDHLGLSWNAVAKIAASNALYSGISAITGEVSSSSKEALDVSLRLAAIQTIDKTKNPAYVWVEGMRELNAQNGQGLIENLTATYQALSNQVVEGSQALLFQAEASKFATVALTTQSAATDVASSVIKSWGLSYSDANEIFAKLFKTIELGRLTGEELSHNFGRISVQAATLGLDLDQVGAALAVITDKGVDAAAAQTLLRNVLNKLTRPSPELQEAINGIGYSSATAALKVMDLGTLLGKLEAQSGSSAEEIVSQFRDIRASTGRMIFDEEGRRVFAQYTAEMAKAVESYGEKVSLVYDSLEKKADRAKQRVSDVFTLDVAMPMLQGLSNATNGFEDLASGVEEASGAISFLGGAAIPIAIAGVTKLLWSVTKLSAFGGPWGLPILAGTMAISGAVGVLVSDSLKLEQENDRLYKNWVKGQVEVLDASTKLREELYTKTVSSIDEASRSILESFASRRVALNELGKPDTRAIKDYASEVTELQRKISEFHNISIDTTKASIEKIRADLKSIQSDSIRAVSNIAELQLEKRLVGKSRQSQYNIYSSEISRLQMGQQSAAESGDFDKYKEITSQIERQLASQKGIASTQTQVRKSLDLAIKSKELELSLDSSLKALLERRQKDEEIKLSKQKDLLADQLSKAESIKSFKISELDTVEEILKVDERRLETYSKIEQSLRNQGASLELIKQVQNAKEELEYQQDIALKQKQLSDEEKAFNIKVDSEKRSAAELRRSGIESDLGISNLDKKIAEVVSNLSVEPMNFIGKILPFLAGQEVPTEAMSSRAIDSMLPTNMEQLKKIASTGQYYLRDRTAKSYQDFSTALQAIIPSGNSDLANTFRELQSKPFQSKSLEFLNNKVSLPNREAITARSRQAVSQIVNNYEVTNNNNIEVQGVDKTPRQIAKEIAPHLDYMSKTKKTLQ